MPLCTFTLDCISIERIFDHAERRRAKSPQYMAVDNGLVYEAYLRARRYNLRIDRIRNIVRDNRLGIISRPVNSSEWPEATPDEAREALCHEIWCDAVRAYNVKTAA